MLSIIRAVVATNTSMVASENEMPATIVLPHQRVENRFAGTSVTHSSRQNTQDCSIGRIIVLEEYLITTHAYISRDIVTLGLSNQRMQVETVYILKCAFL